MKKLLRAMSTGRQPTSRPPVGVVVNCLVGMGLYRTFILHVFHFNMFHPRTHGKDPPRDG